MNILCTICARGGSKGIKNKNIRPLGGKPLIAHTIEQAKKWGRASHIIVSTDSDEIAKVATEYGATIPFMRPSDLATDSSGKLPVLTHALASAETFFKEKFDLVVDLDPTAPIRKITDLEKCLELYVEKKPKSLFSVFPATKSPYFNMVELDEEGFAHFSKVPKKPVLRRQDSPLVYSLNASIYFYRREFLLKDKPLSAISEESVVYVMDELAGVDIDREVDFKFVEFLIGEGLWNFEG